MSAQAAALEDEADGSASAVLQSIAARIDGPAISLGAVVDALDDRALGMLLLLVTLPTALPLVPGVHSAFAVPIAIVALQMLLGRRTPWLPAALRDRRIPADTFRTMTRWTTPWLKRAEAVARPRTAFMRWPHADRVLAFFLIVIAIVIGFPGTGTIGIPGMCATVVAIGIIERDGVLALGGVALGLAYEVAVFAGGYELVAFVLHKLHLHA
ncbi:MAG: exopolysaccharide biosynthesis protein [Parvularculaceae bacterium]|nr:exopolysaccharide biosynthesis protein [Parvularculaceae bacterium]